MGRKSCRRLNTFSLVILLLGNIEKALSQTVLSVQNVIPGATAIFECSSHSITSTSSFEIKKDNVLMYECINIAFICSALRVDTDYSVVTFTGIGTTLGKGTFTVANADQTRDGGYWTCSYDSSPASNSDTLVVSDWSQTGKAVFTKSKSNSTRDDGVWTCSGDDITHKSKEITLNIREAGCRPLWIDTGRVTYTYTTYRYTAKYTCDYDIEGNDTRMCQANGSWSDVPPVCSAKSSVSTSKFTSSIGPAVGGTIGGLLGVVLVGAIVYLLKRRVLDTSSNTTMRNTTPDGNRVYDTLHIPSPAASPYQTFELNVKQDPKIIQSEKHQTTFKCQPTQSRPAANITWYLDNAPLFGGPSTTTPISGDIVITTGSLTLTVNRTAGGTVLSCRATNYFNIEPVKSTVKPVNTVKYNVVTK